LDNLKIRDYPLDTSIEICKLYDLKEPQAFLYLRSGAVEKVLEIYLAIFCNNLKKIKENPDAGINFNDDFQINVNFIRSNRFNEDI